MNTEHTEALEFPENTPQKKKRAKHSGDGQTESFGDEGKLTKEIERYTTYLPSGAFLSTAVAAMGLSAVLHVFGQRHNAQFIGQWVPTILIMGLYNKLVKLEGSTRDEK